MREGKFPDPIRYYEFLHNKIVLKFLPRFTDQTVKEEFQCVLAKNMKYEQVFPSREGLTVACGQSWGTFESATYAFEVLATRE